MSKKNLQEALGVPPNILDVAQKIHGFILKDLKKEGTNEIDEDEDYTFSIVKNLQVSDLKIENTEITFNFRKFEERVNKPELIQMGVRFHLKYDKKTYKLKLKGNPANLNLMIMIAIPTYNSSFNYIYDFFKNSKDLLISSLSHEIKHQYDSFKSGFESPQERAKYRTYTMLNFAIRPINTFLFYLYYTTLTEQLVRPTEVSSLMKSSKVKKDKFIDFLLNTEVYKTYKEISEYSLEKFILGLKKDIVKVDELLKHFDENLDNDDEKIKRVLELLYINLSNSHITEFKRMISENPFEMIVGFIGDKNDVFNKFVSETQKFRDNPMKYFEYEEKKLKFVSNNMLKKLSKLYDMISEDNNSIKNWELHHKINKKLKLENKYLY